MKVLKTVLFAAAVGLVASPAGSADKKANPLDPVQIMLKSFELPPAGGGELITFTPFVVVYDQELLWDVSYGEPKIRDAFNMELLTRKVKVDAKGHPILKPLQKRMRALANRALKRKLIKRLYLVEGEYDKEWRPNTPPPVPNHRDCSRIELRTKRIK